MDLNGQTDVYFVVTNGNVLRCVNVNKKPAMRVYERFRKRGLPVDIWYCYSDNLVVLLDCDN